MRASLLLLLAVAAAVFGTCAAAPAYGVRTAAAARLASRAGPRAARILAARRAPSRRALATKSYACDWHPEESRCDLSMPALETALKDLKQEKSNAYEILKMVTSSVDCDALTEEADCASHDGECIWSNNDCGSHPTYAFDKMSSIKATCPADMPAEMSMMASQAETMARCSSTPKADCTGDCMWTEEDCGEGCTRGNCGLNFFAMMGGESGETSMFAMSALCASKPEVDCTGNCTWSLEGRECNVDFFWMAQYGTGSDAMGELIAKGFECGFTQSQSACDSTEGCVWEWDEESGEYMCTVDAAVASEAMLQKSDDPMTKLMALSMMCADKEEKDCSGDCAWQQDEESGDFVCSTDDAVAMGIMFGVDSSPPSAEQECTLYTKVYAMGVACGELTSQAACSNDPTCTWEADNNECGVSTMNIITSEVMDTGATDALLALHRQCTAQASESACGAVSADLGGKAPEKVQTKVGMELSGDQVKGGVTEEMEEKIVEAFREANGLKGGEVVEVASVTMAVKGAVSLAGLTVADWSADLEQKTAAAIAKTADVAAGAVSIIEVGAPAAGRRLLEGGLDVKYAIEVAEGADAAALASKASAAVSDGTLLAEVQAAGVPATGVAQTEAPKETAEVEMVVQAEAAVEPVGSGDMAAALSEQGVMVEVGEVSKEASDSGDKDDGFWEENWLYIAIAGGGVVALALAAAVVMRSRGSKQDGPRNGTMSETYNPQTGIAVSSNPMFNTPQGAM